MEVVCQAAKKPTFAGISGNDTLSTDGVLEKLLKITKKELYLGDAITRDLR